MILRTWYAHLSSRERYPSSPNSVTDRTLAQANEDLRLRYRYLDLRRAELTSNLKKRSDVAFLVRSTLHDQGACTLLTPEQTLMSQLYTGFTEVETPMLLNSTPEGAREYLVPTRVRQAASDDAGPAQPLFYALSQSPQQPKQLLVVSGAVDRYYQIARCFRDEDGRKDRQPEFTQVDLEMAWVSWGREPSAQTGEGEGSGGTWRIGGHEVRDVVEGVIRNVWRKVEGVELVERFRVMSYHEAMSRYGSDKPDLRFAFEVGGFGRRDDRLDVERVSRLKISPPNCPNPCARRSNGGVRSLRPSALPLVPNTPLSAVLLGK